MLVKSLSTADKCEPDEARIQRSYLWWLRVCIILVFLMVLIGGLTRLTESGLSIVEWKLVTGTLPPLSQQAWEEEFAAYQATPEFHKEHYFMELQDFKQIYWLEYIHRLLGRLVGLVFMAPLLYHLATRALTPPLLKRSAWLFLMVCVQGAVGWYMVKSGLVHDPWVSPYKLAFHLSLATVILGLLCWTFWQVRGCCHAGVFKESSVTHAAVTLTLIAIQIVLGAFVAGLDAGYVYNTFPLMDGQWVPLHIGQGHWLEHIPTVQFLHRWGAFVVLAAIIYQWLLHRNTWTHLVLAVAVVQVALGVATLLSVVDIALASAHQMTAMVLVVMQLRYIFVLRQVPGTVTLQKAL